MRGRLAALFLFILLLSGCSMDSFSFLYRITGGLKENLAINLGLVDVDTASIIQSVEDSLASIQPLEAEDGHFNLGSHTLDASSCSSVQRILPAADDHLLDTLATASENSVKSAAVSDYLSALAEGDEEELARNTIRLINSLVLWVDHSLEIHEVLDRFLLDEKRQITRGDVIALQTVVEVFTLALGYFEEGSTVTMDSIHEALDESHEDMDYGYIDAMALGLGQGKSLAITIGSTWLFNALDGVQIYVRSRIS